MDRDSPTPDSIAEFAICVSCGHEKRRPYHCCKQCKLDPSNDAELMVKSVYLSTGRFDDPDEQRAYAAKLRMIGEGIHRGEPPVYDQVELERLREQRAMLDAFTWRALALYFWRLFRPAFYFIVAAWAIVLLLKWLK